MEPRRTLAGECDRPIWSAPIDVAGRGFADQGAEHGARAAEATCFTNDDGHGALPTELPRPSGSRLVGRRHKRFKPLMGSKSAFWGAQTDPHTPEETFSVGGIVPLMARTIGHAGMTCPSYVPHPVPHASLTYPSPYPSLPLIPPEGGTGRTGRPRRAPACYPSGRHQQRKDADTSIRKHSLIIIRQGLDRSDTAQKYDNQGSGANPCRHG